MNPKRRFRQLRDDDRWIGLPPTTSPTPARAHRHGEARPRTAIATTAVAFVIAGVVAIGLWAGLSGLHHAEPADPSPLPSTTSTPRPAVETPCTESERLAPIGCSTYTATAAAGVPGGTAAWTGAPPPRLTLRVLDGNVTALVDSGCNGLTVPVSLDSTSMTVNGSVAQTLELCAGARGAQEHWIHDLFHGTVDYTLDGSDLRLTNGSRVLELTSTSATAPTPSRSASLSASAPPCDLRTLKPTVTSSGSSTGDWVELVAIDDVGKTCDLSASDIRAGTRAAHGGQRSVFELHGGRTTTLAVQAPSYCASGRSNIPSTTERVPLTIRSGPLSTAVGTFPELHCADPSVDQM